jgi:hypothetical protein
LKRGSFGGCKRSRSFAASEWDRRMEDIVKGVLGGEEERHLERFWK